MGLAAGKRKTAHAAPRSRARTLVLRGMSVALGLLVAVVVLEAAQWALGLEPPKLRTKRHLRSHSGLRADYHCYASNPNLEFQPTPAVSKGTWELRTFMLKAATLPLERLAETPWCVEYRYSKNNLRDRNYETLPAPGVLRIAAVGDSFTFGEGVPIDLTLFRQLERLLAPRVEVLNGGRPGFDTLREIGVLSDLAANANCRRALVVFVPNDIELSDELAKRQTYINDLINIRDEYLEERQSRAWYAHGSAILQYLGSQWEMRRIAQETIQWYLDSYELEHNGENLRRLEEHLRQMANMPRCRVALVLYPLIEGLERDYPLAPIHRCVAEMARRVGLPVLDLAPAFTGHTTPSLQVHPTDHHPNGTAHKIAAEAIVDWLRRDLPWFLKLAPDEEPGRAFTPDMLEENGP